MATLSAGHLFTDSSQGAVPAMLPFLVVERSLSYTAASALVLAATISSSVVQPLFGHYSDRFSAPALMPVGVLLGGAGIGLAGIAPSYGLVFAAFVLSGLGVAAFHPEGSRFANYVSGARRATGMSLFVVGGNVGWAVGVVLVTPMILVFGLAGSLLMIVPATAMSIVLWRALPRLETFRPDLVGGRVQRPRSAQPDAWAPFARLSGVIVLRTFVYFGLLTFVPLYYVGVMGASEVQGNVALAAMPVGGAIGTLIGGRLADRFGRRTVLLASNALITPLIVAFLLAGPVWATALVALVGAVVVSTFGVTLLMGQEYLPGRVGLASGVTLGLAIGLGGIGVPLLGLVADGWGLEKTFEVMAILPVLALALALTLPARAPQHEPERAAASADQGLAGG